MRFAFAILAAFALLLAGCTTQASGQQGAPAPATAASLAAPGNSAAQAAPGNATPSATAGITLAQLATHNKESDCWVGYDGKVYDITKFIPNHKNYQALLVPLCGTSDQFKAKFEAKHGLSKVNVLESQPLMGDLAQ